VFASTLISAGWSPAAAAIARIAASAFLLAVPAVLQLRDRWALLRREAGKVIAYGLVAIAGGQLCYFHSIEPIPIGIAVLLEYIDVVPVVGWLWAGPRPATRAAHGGWRGDGGLAFLAGMAGTSRLSPIGIMWGLLEAVSLAAYFLLSAAAGDGVLPPLVMAWAGLCVGAACPAPAAGAGVLHVTAHVGDVELSPGPQLDCARAGTDAYPGGNRLCRRHRRRQVARGQASLVHHPDGRGFLRGPVRMAAAGPSAFSRGVHGRRLRARRRHLGAR
jgi:drug/metabolite transporter (DMT)-like permease